MSVTFQQIKNEFFRLKGKEFRTNFFLSEEKYNTLFYKNAVQVFIEENACFLLTEDDGFQRFYYIVKNIEELNEGLKKNLTNAENTVTSEIVGTKKTVDEISAIFYKNQFFTYTSLVRMSKPRKLVDSNLSPNIHKADQADARRILAVFAEYFDKFAEQIPAQEEINDLINRNCVYYFSDNQEIQGFIIFEINGYTTHLRYWFVHPNYRNKSIGSQLMHLLFTEGKDVKRELFWVIETNYNAIKRYEHYGFVTEDLHNMVLINKNLIYER